MAAEDADRIAAHAHARPRDQTRIDRLAHRRIRRSGAFGAHVALGGVAGHQIVLGRLLGQNRPPRHRFLDRLQIFRAGMQEQVHMGVDQTGHER
jgi:hypothetical protein